MLTSVATLGVAIGALVPPLEHRIASERLDDLRNIAATAALDLRRLPARDLRAGSPRLARIVEGVQARAGAQVALFAASGARLAGTDPAGAEPPSEAGLHRAPAPGPLPARPARVVRG